MKFRGNVVVGVSPVPEGVDGCDRVSGNDNLVSDEMSFEYFTRLGSPWEEFLSSNEEVLVMKWGD